MAIPFDQRNFLSTLCAILVAALVLWLFYHEVFELPAQKEKERAELARMKQEDRENQAAVEKKIRGY